MRTHPRIPATRARWWSAAAALTALLAGLAVLAPVAAEASPADGIPFGSVDSVQWTTGSTVRVRGWAADSDAPTTSLQVHVYVDGAARLAATANGSRPDVGAAFPGYGNAHGFDTSLTVSRGGHEVCVYAINVGGRGTNALLACRGVQVGLSPIGSLDGWQRRPGGIQVFGWALDPETTASIGIHVYVDGAFATVATANGNRPDVGAAFGKGSAHGFAILVPVAVGTHRVCVYAIDTDGDPNGTVGCVTVTLSGDPLYHQDGLLEPVAGGYRVRGWIVDPDTAGPSRLDVYVDGAFTSLPANQPRPDVGAAFPGYGDNHGVDGVVPVTGTPRRVCAYVINVAGAGSNIGDCQTF